MCFIWNTCVDTCTTWISYRGWQTVCQFTYSQTHKHTYTHTCSTPRDNQLHCILFNLFNTIVQQIIVETNGFFRFFFGTDLNFGFGLIFLNSFFATLLSQFAHRMSEKRFMFNQNEKRLKVVSLGMSHGQMETPWIFFAILISSQSWVWFLCGWRRVEFHSIFVMRCYPCCSTALYCTVYSVHNGICAFAWNTVHWTLYVTCKLMCIVYISTPFYCITLCYPVCVHANTNVIVAIIKCACLNFPLFVYPPYPSSFPSSFVQLNALK